MNSRRDYDEDEEIRKAIEASKEDAPEGSRKREREDDEYLKQFLAYWQTLT